MEKMAYIYNGQAEENNSIIVSALGMESVPADLGVEFLYKNFNGILKVNRDWINNIVSWINYVLFSGELNNVDMYMKLYSSSFVLTNVSNTLLFIF